MSNDRYVLVILHHRTDVLGIAASMQFNITLTWQLNFNISFSYLLLFWAASLPLILILEAQFTERSTYLPPIISVTKECRQCTTARMCPIVILAPIEAMRRKCR